MKTLTVITTTFNRGYCINQVYESLLKQKCKDFVWLVIDDGSTDNTREIIEKYIQDDIIEIDYRYKSNGGMHTARNLAYSCVQTEINVIIDSDDWLAENSVELIIHFWKENKDEHCAGFITQNTDPSGRIIGTDFPKGLIRCSYRDFFEKYEMHGDKKIILRSDLAKRYPFPEYENEKFYPASYKYYMLGQEYDFLICNAITCIVDYNSTSMTRDKYAQYRTCPRSFMHYRKTMINLGFGFKQDSKNMMHYVMEQSYAREKADREIIRNPLYYFCYLPGKLLFMYLNMTRRKY